MYHFGEHLSIKILRQNSTTVIKINTSSLAKKNRAQKSGSFYFLSNRTLVIQPLGKHLPLDHNSFPIAQNPFRTWIFFDYTSHFLISDMERNRSLFDCHKIFVIECNCHFRIFIHIESFPFSKSYLILAKLGIT